MTTAAKIDLSAKELELVCNTEWILTKHIITQKVYQLFGDLLPQFENILTANTDGLPAEIFSLPPKISKGENYLQLPYVMLDYPRCFGREDTAAIRTFFWWGNFFSVSLQLSGIYQQAAAANLINSYEALAKKDYSICIYENPWQHHFGADNSIALNKVSKETFSAWVLQKPFVKLSAKIPLSQWPHAPAFIAETFHDFAQLLKMN